MNFKNSKCLSLTFLLLMGISAFSQKVTIDESKVKVFIDEVYSNVIEELKYDKPENIIRFSNFIKRVYFSKLEVEPKKFKMLSQVPIINTYNKDVSFDSIFDPNSFNPLKYKFEVLNQNEKVFYKVDNSDYFIIIEPQGN